MASSVLGNPMLPPVSIGNFGTAQEGSTAKAFLNADTGLTVQATGNSSVNVGVQLNAQTHGSSMQLGDVTAALATPGATVVDSGPSIDALAAMLVEVDVQSQVGTTSGNMGAAPVTSGMHHSGGMQPRTATLDVTNTSH